MTGRHSAPYAELFEEAKAVADERARELADTLIALRASLPLLAAGLLSQYEVCRESESYRRVELDSIASTERLQAHVDATVLTPPIDLPGILARTKGMAA